jgi:hypothetical protein
MHDAAVSFPAVQTAAATGTSNSKCYALSHALEFVMIAGLEESS